MKIHANEKLIKRNKFLSRVTLISGLAFMGFAFITLINSDITSPLFVPSMIAGAIGIILSTINIPLSARFGASPRPDELISASLKGLDNSYHLFHYTTSIPHMLAGPNGIWVFNTFMVQGTVYYVAKKKKWKLVKSGRFFSKLFGTEGIGNPSLEAESTLHDFQKITARIGEIPELPEPQAIAIFIGKEVILETDEAPFPAVTLDKLKAYIRKTADLPMEQKNAAKELVEKIS